MLWLLQVLLWPGTAVAGYQSSIATFNEYCTAWTSVPFSGDCDKVQAGLPERRYRRYPLLRILSAEWLCT